MIEEVVADKGCTSKWERFPGTRSGADRRVPSPCAESQYPVRPGPSHEALRSQLLLADQAAVARCSMATRLGSNKLHWRVEKT
jgi:hypothetical protein